jgi:hypothetical protein
MKEPNFFSKEVLPEKLMNNLVYAIKEEIDQKNRDVIESYEFYANRLRLRLFEKPDAVSARLSEGYQSLLLELTESKKNNREK